MKIVEVISVGKRETQKGFVLVGALIMLLLVTALTFGVVYMTRADLTMAGSDTEQARARYGAQAGIEKMVSDIYNVYANQSPTTAQLDAITSTPPSVPGSTLSLYQLAYPKDGSGNPVYTKKTLKYGPNAGLFAQILPITIDVVATRNGGANGNSQAHITRSAEVALIPLFQFGVFSQTDLSYFPGVDYDFGGRVHTNGNLYLAAETGSTLTFHDKVSAYRDIIRYCMANTQTLGGFSGTVKIPTQSGGCDGSPTSTTCRALASTEGSLKGTSCPQSAANSPNWNTISRGSPTGSPLSGYNSMLINGDGGIGNKGTGARQLSLPFTPDGAKSIEILRRPTNLNESLNTATVGSDALESARLYNLANIQVLLADTPQELPTTYVDPTLDPDIVDIGNPLTSFTATGDTNGPTFFASSAAGSLLAGPLADPLTHGHAYVEARIRINDGSQNGVWKEVTQAWLQRGFARGLTPPNSEAGVTLGTTVSGGTGGSFTPTLAVSATNTVHKNAILLLQQLTDNMVKVPTNGPYYTHTVPSPTLRTGANFIPINLYDTREGSVDDTNDGKCYVNGVINTVEIDMANLNSWLGSQTIGTVMAPQEDGYLLYFSDRRGMQAGHDSTVDNTLPRVGEYGWEDVYKPLNTTATPKDVNGNSKLDIYGAANIGNGFAGIAGFPAPTSAANIDARPYKPLLNGSGNSLCDSARRSWVSGARHALTLVNGSLGNLPKIGNGGFTVASENPVYVVGDYNANQNSGGSTPFNDTTHLASAVIADSVTLLSWNWSNINSFDWPTDSTERVASPSGNKSTFYRMAVVSGKGQNFAYTATGYPYGTDGGANNFLRYLESWGPGVAKHYYMGSLVSLYYSVQGTGTFKCCSGTVYYWPTRNFFFDKDFTNPDTLPPGTPRLRDVDNTGATQDLAPQDQNGQQ